MDNPNPSSFIMLKTSFQVIKNYIPTPKNLPSATLYLFYHKKYPVHGMFSYRFIPFLA
tara:strand:- start:2292 stop:2465 length:174 start_codon:yes stop_codon:yes gene_type:complete